MSVESLKSFFDVASLVLVLLTAVTGTGVLVTGHIINKRQAVQLRQFDHDLTQSKMDLGKQQERAAIAERDLAILKDTVRPRRLTQEQQAALVDMLSGGPNGPVTLVCLACDDEATRFAKQIDTVLRLAGWPASVVNQNTYAGDAPTGAWIQIKSVKTAPAFASRIQQAFFAIGMPLGGAETPGLADGTVQVIVSRKPVHHD
jgi:hypothetical protein